MKTEHNVLQVTRGAMRDSFEQIMFEGLVTWVSQTGVYGSLLASSPGKQLFDTKQAPILMRENVCVSRGQEGACARETYFNHTSLR